MCKSFIVLLISFLVIGCSSNGIKPDLVPYTTNTVALFESEGVYYRLHPDQSCSTEMVVKVIVDMSWIAQNASNTEFISDAADKVSEHCDDLADVEVELVQLFLFEGNKKHPFKKDTLKSGIFGWNSVEKILDDDSTFDDLRSEDRALGKITPGLSRPYIDLKSRACKAYINWFSEFSNYGISPYRISTLTDKSIYVRIESAEKVDDFPAELKAEIDDYYNFPEALITGSIFSKYFNGNFSLLSEREKGNFVGGAEQCFKLSELKAGKVEIAPMAWGKVRYRTRQTSAFVSCHVMNRWVESLPRNEAYNKNTNYERIHQISAPFYQAYMLTEPYFNQMFYGPYMSLSLEQRITLLASLRNCGERDKNAEIYRKFHDHTAYDFESYRAFYHAIQRGLSPTAQQLPQTERHWRNLEFEKRQFVYLEGTILKWENLLSFISSLEKTSPVSNIQGAHSKVLTEALEYKNQKVMKLSQMFSATVDFLSGDLESRFIEATKGYLLKDPVGAINAEIKFLSSQIESIDVERLTGFGTEDMRSREEILSVVRIYTELENWLSTYITNSDKHALFTEALLKARISAFTKLVNKDISLSSSLLSGELSPSEAKRFFDNFDKIYGPYYDELELSNLIQPAVKMRSRIIDTVEEGVVNQLLNLAPNAYYSGQIYELKLKFLSDFDGRFPEGRAFASLFDQAKEKLAKTRNAALERKEQELLFRRYYSDYEISQMNNRGVISTKNSAPSPKKEDIFRTYFREMKPFWKNKGFPLYIGDYGNSMEITYSALGMEVDFSTGIDIRSFKGCTQLKENEYSCSYKIWFLETFNLGDKSMNRRMNMLHSLSTSKFKGEFDLTHTFIFDESGWRSKDAAKFYASEKQKRTDSVNRMARSLNSTETCLYYKGFKTSCW